MPAPGEPEAAPGPGPKPLTLTGLLLLDPRGYDPAPVDSVVVDDLGIGVVRRRGEAPRVLPWASVVAHAVEPWGGGVIPAWWVEPAPRLAGTPAPVPDAQAVEPVHPATAHRHLPHAEAGALFSVQTRTGTYRFLRSGGDPVDLATRIGAFAVRHQGPSGLSSVTTVAPARLRRGYGGRTGWARVRPVLAVLLVAVVITAVTLILLQSAGVIHLPFLGGGASSASSRSHDPTAAPISRGAVVPLSSRAVRGSVHSGITSIQGAPSKAASPNAKTPPSDATIQYPPPFDAGAIPTIG